MTTDYIPMTDEERKRFPALASLERPTTSLRDVMAAAHREHLSIRRAWDEPGDCEHATAWEVRNWDGDLVGAVHRVRYISDGVRISYGEGPHWTVTLLHGPLYDDADLATLTDSGADRVDVPDATPARVLTAAGLTGLISEEF